MGITIGTPVMMLDRNNHFGKESKKHGNMRAVLCEAMSERQCKDVDLDRNKTQQNKYFDFGYFDFTSERDEADFYSGNAWADIYEAEAERYRTVDKNGKEKKLRSDANIAFAGIIKPDKASMDKLSQEDQHRLLTDSLDIIKDMYAKRGMQINTAVMHTDEGNPHIHYFGYDPNYKLSDKFKLPFYRALNVTEFPKRMREKGWDVEELTGYLEDTEGMSTDEIEQYKTKKKASKKSGRSSADYKNDQGIENAEQAREAVEADLRRLEANKAKYIMQARKEAAEAASSEAAAIREKALAEAAQIKQQVSEDVLAKAKKWDEHVAERNKSINIPSNTDNLFGIDYSR